MWCDNQNETKYRERDASKLGSSTTSATISFSHKMEVSDLRIRFTESPPWPTAFIQGKVPSVVPIEPTLLVQE